MSSSSGYRAIGAAAIAIATASPQPRAQAQSSQTAKLQVSPHVLAVFAAKSGLLEIGPEYARHSPGRGVVLRALIRLPYDKDNAAPRVQLDRYSSTWRGIVSADLERDRTRATGPISRWRAGVQMEFGTANYRYYPSGGSSAAVERHGSVAAEIRWFSYSTEARPAAVQWAPQVCLRFAREWTKGDLVGVVVPGSGGAPSTVKNLVITPPSGTPQLAVRVAVPTYLGRGLMGFGPAFTYALSGDRGRWNPTTKSGRAGLETWVFYFPTQEGATNLRLGAAPFVSYRTHGSDAFSQWEYGALLQVRVGTAALEF